MSYKKRNNKKRTKTRKIKSQVGGDSCSNKYYGDENMKYNLNRISERLSRDTYISVNNIADLLKNNKYTNYKLKIINNQRKHVYEFKDVLNIKDDKLTPTDFKVELEKVIKSFAKPFTDLDDFINNYSEPTELFGTNILNRISRRIKTYKTSLTYSDGSHADDVYFFGLEISGKQNTVLVNNEIQGNSVDTCCKYVVHDLGFFLKKTKDSSFIFINSQNRISCYRLDSKRNKNIHLYYITSHINSNKELRTINNHTSAAITHENKNNRFYEILQQFSDENKSKFKTHLDNLLSKIKSKDMHHLVNREKYKFTPIIPQYDSNNESALEFIHDNEIAQKKHLLNQLITYQKSNNTQKHQIPNENNFCKFVDKLSEYPNSIVIDDIILSFEPNNEMSNANNDNESDDFNLDIFCEECSMYINETVRLIHFIFDERERLYIEFIQNMVKIDSLTDDKHCRYIDLLYGKIFKTLLEPIKICISSINTLLIKLAKSKENQKYEYELWSISSEDVPNTCKMSMYDLLEKIVKIEIKLKEKILFIREVTIFLNQNNSTFYESTNSLKDIFINYKENETLISNIKFTMKLISNAVPH